MDISTSRMQSICVGQVQRAEEARLARCAGTHAHWHGRLMTHKHMNRVGIDLLVQARCARPNQSNTSLTKCRCLPLESLPRAIVWGYVL